MMTVLQLVIGVSEQETEYIRRLADYIRTSPYGKQWQVTGISSALSLRQYVKGGYPIDLLLIQPWLLEEAQLIAQEIPIALLVHSQAGSKVYEGEGDKEPKLERIMQYQPIPRLLSEAATIVSGCGKSLSRASDGRSLGIAAAAIYSPYGGIGKTALAAHMVKALAEQGLQVFYLSADPFPELLERAGDDVVEAGITRLLYQLKASPEHALQLFRDIRTRHEQLGADCFRLGVSGQAEELITLEPEEAEQLLRFVRDSGDYDRIVIDMSSVLNAAGAALLRGCDRIVWLKPSLEQGLEDAKTEMSQCFIHRVYPELGGMLSQRVRFVTAAAAEERLRLSGVREGAGRADSRTGISLPYVPQWTVSAGLLQQPSAAYRAAVLRVIDSIGFGGGASFDYGGQYPSA